jgi:hypothetical protein
MTDPPPSGLVGPSAELLSLRVLLVHVLTDTQDGDGGVALDGDEVAGND